MAISKEKVSKKKKINTKEKSNMEIIKKYIKKKNIHLNKNTIIAISVIVGCIIFSLFINLINKKSEDKKIEDLNKEAINKSTAKIHQLLNGDLLFEVDNNSDINVHKKFSIKLYDEEGVLAGEIDSEIKHVFPHRKTYGKSVQIGNDYSKYDYEVETSAITDKIDYYTDKIKVLSSKVENDKIKVQVLNDSGEFVSEMKYAVLYYNKQKEIIGYNEVIRHNVNVGMTVEDYFDNFVDDGNFNKVKYDHYEVVVNYAFYYDEFA